MNAEQQANSNVTPTIGFLGLGAMGGPMARNLRAAGYSVCAFDLRAEQMAACVAAGCTAAESEAAAVAKASIVVTSLPSSSVFVRVAEEHLLPNASAGQVFIDMGTTSPAETRRLAAAFAAKGASLVDAPVSGGSAGAERGTLHIFVGGEQEEVQRALPVLRVLGAPEQVVVCGPSGAGQVVKGVNQLAMGLGSAAYLEAVAYGVNAGVKPEAILQAVGGNEPWRQQFAGVARRVVDRRGESVFVKYPELPLFLAEAKSRQFPLPLTDALYEFCRRGECRFRDNMNRATVSFWNELAAAGRR